MLVTPDEPAVAREQGDAVKFLRAQGALEMTSQLAGTQDQQHLLAVLADDLFEMFRVDRVIVLLRDPQHRGFTVGLSRTGDNRPIESLGLSRTLMRKVLTEQMALITSDARMEGGLLPSLREYAARFGLTLDRLALARPDALVMHPGPMNEGVEISPEVAVHPRSVITDQVTNGVAVRMALLYLLAGAAGRTKEAGGG